MLAILRAFQPPSLLTFVGDQPDFVKSTQLSMNMMFEMDVPAAASDQEDFHLNLIYQILLEIPLLDLHVVFLFRAAPHRHTHHSQYIFSHPGQDKCNWSRLNKTEAGGAAALAQKLEHHAGFRRLHGIGINHYPFKSIER